MAFSPSAAARVGSRTGPSNLETTLPAMKKRLWTSLLTLTLALFAAAPAWSAVLLQWERSTDLQTWEKVPAKELIFTADGGLVVPATQAQTYYRLRVGSGQGNGFIQV